MLCVGSLLVPGSGSNGGVCAGVRVRRPDGSVGRDELHVCVLKGRHVYVFTHV